MIERYYVVHKMINYLHRWRHFVTPIAALLRVPIGCISMVIFGLPVCLTALKPLGTMTVLKESASL